MEIITGLDEAKVEDLLKKKLPSSHRPQRKFQSWHQDGRDQDRKPGDDMPGQSDLKSGLVQGGVAGGLIGLVSAPATLTAAALTVVVGVGHTLATYDPDYEVLKDYINQRLRVIYKK